MTSEKENIVSFGAGVDLRDHRFILDFLNKIDVEGSMAYLPITIHDDSTDQEDYVEYLYEYVLDELSFLIGEIAESDPKQWNRPAAALREQLNTSPQLIRFIVLLQGKENELHELVLVRDVSLEAYVIVAYNFNNESLVTMATEDYLHPDIEGFQVDEPFVIRMS